MHVRTDILVFSLVSSIFPLIAQQHSSVIPETIPPLHKVRIVYHQNKLKHDPAHQQVLNDKLIRAIKDHKFTDVQVYVHAGANINEACDAHGQKAVALAVYFHDTIECNFADPEKTVAQQDEYASIIKYLLDYPTVDPNIFTGPHQEKTILESALARGNLTTIRLLLRAGAQLPENFEEKLFMNRDKIEALIQEHKQLQEGSALSIQEAFVDHITHFEGQERNGTAVAQQLQGILRSLL